MQIDINSKVLRIYCEKKVIIDEDLYEKVFWTKFQTWISNNRQSANGDGAWYINFHQRECLHEAFFRNWERMPESELLNHFQYIIQCMSGNYNTDIKIILYNGKFIISFPSYFENIFQEYEKEKSWILT